MASVAPPRLSELQAWLQTVWTDPRGVDAGLKTRAGSRVLNWIVPAPPLSPRDRLAVYYDAYFLRLLDSLGSDFPAAKRALGEDGFRALSAGFLSRNGSDSTNISDLGARLPGFAKDHPLATRHPFLPDLLALEWAVLSALFTGRLPALDPAMFSGVEDWGKTRLVFDPTLRLLALGWPVHELWDRRFQKGARGARLRARRPAFLAVFRDESWVRVLPLEKKAFTTLERLRKGSSLAEACERSGASEQEIRGWFSGWVGAGLIKGAR